MNQQTIAKTQFAVAVCALLRKRQLSEAISVHERTLNYWMRERIIPFRKVGKVVLFDPAEVQAALDRFRVPAAGERKAKRRIERVEAQPVAGGES